MIAVACAVHNRTVGFFGRSLSDLVTTIIENYSTGWSVTFASDGKSPRDLAGESLGEAVSKAEAAVVQLYTGHSEAASAELQHAIYPWGQGGDVILDIEGTGGQLTAHDIQGSGITVKASTLEEMVSAAEDALPDRSKAMFRWIKRVSELEQPVDSSPND